uniref:CG-1 domain-containing protein n=1 Tax=Opuntia streptacantha TaxID=393608 RepID=A0A7C9ALR5_OPUST
MPTQSGFDIDQLVQEAKTRWLKPPEVLFILQNYEQYQITQQAPQKPPSGSLFLFNKRVLRFFRKDGYSWRKKKDGRTVGEAHERLKVGSAEALNCYYAHGEENPHFQRRSYWMLDPAYEHIVLVHYRDIEGRSSSRTTAGFLQGSSSTCSQIHRTYSVQNSRSGSLSDLRESCQNHSSPGSLDVSSDAARSKGVDSFNGENGTENSIISSDGDISHALRRLEEQLSLDDDSLKDYTPVDLQDWNEDEDKYRVLDAFTTGAEGLKDLRVSAYVSPNFTATPEMSTKLLERSLGMPFGANPCLTIAKEQRFTIHEISPEWGFTNDPTKVIIIGSFLCDPSDCTWHCMFGNVEVPLQIIQNGVLCCQAPPHPSGKVTLCITSGNRESCSEIREFEFREKYSTCLCCGESERGTTSTEELLLLVRFVQMLLANSSQRGENNELAEDLSIKPKGDYDSWGQILEALLFGCGSSSTTIDWLLQQLLKDKLKQWLISKSLQGEGADCSLSKKEQGIIHMIAGLGYEWALNPILGCGVGINFRDINGWTALHWAARFGREKMVAALIASGASAVAVTDPNSQDPVGRTPAHIAAAYGHKGLAGYLSEVALTSHLSSLTLEESELPKGSADVEAELAVDRISKDNVNSSEGQLPLKQSLAAVRNAAQAAARIQAAFRAHSFRKRQQREAETSAAFAGVDEYGFTANDIWSLSAASKLSFRKYHEHNKAALSIQKNYRGWKGRKEFLALRRKVVKIQAHVRGYQARKKYEVICWAVGVLEKAVLRWRRKAGGLRGFKPETECIDEDEDDEDIIRVYRKKKVNVAIDEAVLRVVTMVECPEAREQYHRVLGKYQEAKAQPQGATDQGASTSRGGVSNMEW